MTNPQDVTPIATTKARRFVATVPCPRPGCGGKITLTAGDKGSAWGTCKAPTAHVGKTGKPNVCGAAVNLSPPQTRALLEGKTDGKDTPASSPPAPKPASSSERRAPPQLAAKRSVAGAGPGDGKPGPRAGDDPPSPAPERRVGFFKY